MLSATYSVASLHKEKVPDVGKVGKRSKKTDRKNMQKALHNKHHCIDSGMEGREILLLHLSCASKRT